MASLLSLLFAFHLIVIFSSISLTSSSTTEVFSKQDPAFPSTKHMEKITQLHFYWHDNLTVKNPTTMQIVGPPKGSVGGFGAIFMMDDPLTEGPSPSSKLIGRSQGIYAVASPHDFELLMMAMNFVFAEGMYNGSTNSSHGRNPIMQKVREMPVVGGSGVFRFARGFALVKTYMFNATSGVAIVEYNVSLLHL